MAAARLPIGGVQRLGMGRGGGGSGIPSPALGGGSVVGGQSVPFSRSSSGSEGSFTTTTVTLPKSGKPTTLLVTFTTGVVLVQVVTVGSYTVSGVATAQVPLTLDISFLAEQTSVGVQTEVPGAAATVAGSVGYA